MSYLVGVARCENYDREETARAVSEAVANAGGLPPAGAKNILIKANMLSPSEPDKAVTTHPEILRGIIGEIKKNFSGAAIHIADNPGYIFTGAETLLGRTAIGALGEAEDVTTGLLADKGVRDVSRGDFKSLASARISSRYLDAEYCVNAAKLKTHVETEISACVKNIFGTADIGTRKNCHNSRSMRRLAEAIVDLYTIRPPEFHILDAVVGMEGDGPSHGSPKKTGFVLAGRNALAVDFAAAAIMGYKNPAEIPLMAAAVERGIGPASKDEIDLAGAEWEELPVPGFKKSSGLARLLPTFLRGFAHRLLSITPKLDEPRCVKCGICARVCPVDAIRCEAPGGEKIFPAIDRAKCVSCLCCHEMCPTGAMTAHKNLIARLVENARS
jgi:uncharacterized protein (DUF362 family)/NAD-dependent dihydropyrimidine dehydrogenase PreA subunit